MFTKSQINRIGRRIKKSLENGVEISEEDLLSLQKHRTTFQQDLAIVFNELTSISKKIRKDSIVSFRVKRIESILSKIKREPTMALGNMGDIAGCRVILYSEEALFKLSEKIRERFTVKYDNNYLIKTKEDGYRGHHFYIVSPVNENRLIEIQLRSVEAHKWASLVEIIDILYNAKIKEGESYPELQRFLFLMSNKNKLSVEEKFDIITIDREYDIYKRLNEIFLSNHLKIRNEWLDLTLKENNYIIIEVDINKQSNLYGFENYEEAESKYFEMFEVNSNSNFVLTHIYKPNFNRVCIAYASYMLVNHDYLKDWSEFVSDIYLGDSSVNFEGKNHYLREYIYRNIHDQMDLVSEELKELKKQRGKDSNLEYIEKLEEWLVELDRKAEVFNKVFGSKEKPLPRAKSFADMIKRFLSI